MDKYELAPSLPKVTELSFAAASMGSLLSKISEEEGGQLILEGLEEGINFVETTAQMYRPYSHIYYALTRFHGDVVLSVRSTSGNYHDVLQKIEEARQSLERDSIDLFMLHLNKSTASLKDDKSEAFKALQTAKTKGWIRTIGLSTHSVKLLHQATELDFIDVLNPAINHLGWGILDGELSDMLRALQKGKDSGKGLYAGKTLAGGRLAPSRVESLSFVRSISGISSIAVGMSNRDELSANLEFFNDSEFPKKSPIELSSMAEIYSKFSGFSASERTVKRFPTFCKGCGICINNCPAQAMTIQEGKVQIDEGKCLLCGYCAYACPQFALRLD